MAGKRNTAGPGAQGRHGRSAGEGSTQGLGGMTKVLLGVQLSPLTPAVYSPQGSQRVLVEMEF